MYWASCAAVADVKGWYNEVASMYEMQSIPYNFLIDPDGNIVAEDIKGRELEGALSKCLKLEMKKRLFKTASSKLIFSIDTYRLKEH